MKRIKALSVLLALWMMLYPVYGNADISLSCGQSGPTGADAFNINRTSTTVLTINPNATSTNIETARVAASTYRFTASATATISAGTGTAYIYVDSAGVLTVGDNGLTITCSGCTHVGTGITAYPIDAVPLWTWTSTTGTWDSAGGTDNRASQFRSGLADTSTSGLVARTGANGAVSARTLQPSTNSGLTWTNGDGVSGAPVPVLTLPVLAEFTPACSNATAGPGSFDIPTSGAPTTTCFGTTTTQGALDFADAATSTASFHYTLPADWTGVVDVDLYWFANAASSNAVRWSVQNGCVADSEATNTGPSYNTASASNSAYTGTANQRKTTSLTGVSTTNCAAGETMYWQVQRIGADAGDTLTATAELLSVRVKIRRSF